MLCTRCHKRPAVVFISQSMNSSESQGLCLVCARELGIKPVNDLMDKMGITEEQMEQMEEELSGLMNPEEGEADGEDGAFTPGGAATFPFLQNIFPGFSRRAVPAVRKRRPQRLPGRKRQRIKASGAIWMPTVQI